MSSEAAFAPRDVWLKDRAWDRIFVVGGALLVPIPILVFYLCESLGLGGAASEDIVTVMVMVLVGGPHVVATYTRTVFDPNFLRRDRPWAIAGLLVFLTVSGAALSSAFLDVTIFGHPPIHFVLTFFFFWAGIHIVHQASYLAVCYDKKRASAQGVTFRPSRWWNSLDYLLMLGCLYPVSFFRMSMTNPADPSGMTANPDALATQIVTSVSGSQAFADAYPFKIGRVSPVLPEFVLADAFWISVVVGYLALIALFVIKTRRELRAGVLNRPKFRLVAITAAVGTLVPLAPNLDSAFQGFNAWHSFQYLGVLWLMNRRSFDRGKVESKFVKRLSEPGRHLRFYGTALTLTLSMILLFVFVGWLLQSATGADFTMTGIDNAPLNEATGRPFYRPGTILLAYYSIGFGLLLVHYLHDGVFFFRTRYLVDDKQK